jgi:hypothetical protein
MLIYLLLLIPIVLSNNSKDSVNQANNKDPCCRTINFKDIDWKEWTSSPFPRYLAYDVNCYKPNN